MSKQFKPYTLYNLDSAGNVKHYEVREADRVVVQGRLHYVYMSQGQASRNFFTGYKTLKQAAKKSLETQKFLLKRTTEIIKLLESIK